MRVREKGAYTSSICIQLGLFSNCPNLFINTSIFAVPEHMDIQYMFMGSSSGVHAHVPETQFRTDWLQTA